MVQVAVLVLHHTVLVHLRPGDVFLHRLVSPSVLVPPVGLLAVPLLLRQLGRGRQQTSTSINHTTYRRPPFSFFLGVDLSSAVLLAAALPLPLGLPPLTLVTPTTTCTRSRATVGLLRHLLLVFVRLLSGLDGLLAVDDSSLLAGPRLAAGGRLRLGGLLGHRTLRATLLVGIDFLPHSPAALVLTPAVTVTPALFALLIPRCDECPGRRAQQPTVVMLTGRWRWRHQPAITAAFGRGVPVVVMLLLLLRRDCRGRVGANETETGERRHRQCGCRCSSPFLLECQSDVTAEEVHPP
mmetsp:Transcript_37016/g.92822  ORF Transcript_37016/g.92822 Transcript_37016/m.92822 type:complete len:296 (+) Transcript_37016:1296-2183(+)